jgi:hypothetical protein
MAYRDELEALRAQVAALEEELANERQRNAAHADDAKPPPVVAASPETQIARRKGRRLHYHRPATYVPLVLLLLGGLRANWRCRPRAHWPEDPPDNLVLYALSYARVPATYLFWVPLYWLTFLAALPIALTITVVGTPLLLPIVATSRVSFAATPSPNWFDGAMSDEAGASLFSIASWLFMPLSLPYVLALEDS